MKITASTLLSIVRRSAEIHDAITNKAMRIEDWKHLPKHRHMPIVGELISALRLGSAELLELSAKIEKEANGE